MGHPIYHIFLIVEWEGFQSGQEDRRLQSVLLTTAPPGSLANYTSCRCHVNKLKQVVMLNN